jgi:methionine synthase II (cobalamin-independent)
MANDYTYRADHVGSLIPPAALLEAHARHARGELDADGLRQAEDAAITVALQMQKAVGIAVASDGEFRRASGSARPLDGDTLAKGEAAYLKAQARRPIKVAVPAARPSRAMPSEQGPESAVMVKRELESLIAAGVDYVQLDAPGYATLLNAQDRAALAAQGIDPERKLEDLLRLDATALSGLERPGHVRIAVHIHRADARGLSTAADCAAAAERLFNELPADRFLLAFDAEDSFDALRMVPKGKVVVLGLVSATTPTLEDVDALLARIDAAAKIIDGDALALSPSAGFAMAASNDASQLTEADQRRKLELVADVATRWWGFAM